MDDKSRKKEVRCFEVEVYLNIGGVRKGVGHFEGLSLDDIEQLIRLIARRDAERMARRDAQR
jgi:hypothetical protein